MKKFLGLGLLILCGCASANRDATQENIPTFSIAVSEYPSWSAFFAASEKGLINGKRGALGPIEEKWKVDIEIKEGDYEPTLKMYDTKEADAVCVTNIDVLALANNRPATAILPTSTSAGGDALVVVGISTPEELKKATVYGLEKSVSQYAFNRGLQELGLNPADFKYANSDPGTAAQSLQLGQAQAVQIWNPYVLQTLRKNPKAKVLFDSKQISGEIIDMIVVANDSLAKDGGKRFAQALIDTYYQLNLLLNGSAREDTLVAIGHKFSSLNAADMDIVCTQTKFFGTPTESLRVFDKTKLVPVMKRVEKFCLESQMVKKLPTIGYDDPKAQMNFSTSYIQDVVKAASAATN